MHRDRITLALFSLTLGLGAAMSCTDSEPIGPSLNPVQTGVGGNNGTGVAGSTTGAAGMTGAAGSAAGLAGTTGTAGSMAGAAGAAGSADGAAGSAGMTGAAGSSVDAGADAGAVLSFAKDIEPIVTTKCGPCHLKAGPDGNLQLMMGMGFASLVTNGSVTTTACKLLDASKKRVVPGSPTTSMFYIKLTTTAASLTTNTCGASMPKMGTAPTTIEKNKIRDWIMGGANP